jgi:hypothetical protein
MNLNTHLSNLLKSPLWDKLIDEKPEILLYKDPVEIKLIKVQYSGTNINSSGNSLLTSGDLDISEYYKFKKNESKGRVLYLQ